MSDNVIHLADHAPVACGDNAGLAHWLRSWADAIDRGAVGEVNTLILIAEDSNGRLGRAVQHRTGIDNARLVGLLHRATNEAGTYAPNFLAED